MVSRAGSAFIPLMIAGLAGCAHENAVPHVAEHTKQPEPARLVALPETFKLVAFNVHGRPARELVQAFTEDPTLAGADLLVLSEARANGGECSEVCLMARELGLYAVYAPGFEDGYKEGLAIVSRVPLEHVRTFDLPIVRALLHREACFALSARVRVAGHVVTIYAVHLSLRLSIDQRLRQMRPVLEDARAQPTPVIIAGDFNTNRFVWLGHTLPIPWRSSTGPFEELVRSYGFATPVTGSGKTFRVVPIRIDGIYTRGFDTEAYGTSQGTAISDHLALWSVMTLRPDSQAL